MENLRISTITCVAELNTHTDLDLFYKHIDIDDKVKCKLLHDSGSKKSLPFIKEKIDR